MDGGGDGFAWGGVDEGEEGKEDGECEFHVGVVGKDCWLRIALIGLDSEVVRN